MYRKVREQDYRKKKLYEKGLWNFYNSRIGAWEYDETYYGHGCHTEKDENGKVWVKKYYKSKGYQTDKKHANRKIRNYKGTIKDGGHCFKICNALWEYY